MVTITHLKVDFLNKYSFSKKFYLSFSINIVYGMVVVHTHIYNCIYLNKQWNSQTTFNFLLQN